MDLEGVHVACLCGDNGHGKSALIDAITWAIWGYARGKSQDSLIHFGESDMWVELEFQARDTRYKVIRRHSRSSRRGTNSKTDLQFQLLTASGFEPMTGNSIRETQFHLQQLIGMDYDTFINSALLLQGRADEFTNKSPGERKEILGKILRLNFYDYLQEKCRKQVIELDRSAREIEASLVFMRQETELREEYEKELRSIDQEMTVATQNLVRQENEMDGLATKIREFELKFTELQ
ncbi:MAG: chromosome segregation protein SMC, partial [Dehalococcoidia bacterium]|nr:chromosome segregation protein SMC [Dehalococcoidia bacterium]